MTTSEELCKNFIDQYLQEGNPTLQDVERRIFFREYIIQEEHGGTTCKCAIYAGGKCVRSRSRFYKQTSVKGKGLDVPRMRAYNAALSVLRRVLIADIELQAEKLTKQTGGNDDEQI